MSQKEMLLEYLKQKPVAAGLCVVEMSPNKFVNENGVVVLYNPSTDRFNEFGVSDYPMTAFQTKKFFTEAW